MLCYAVLSIEEQMHLARLLQSLGDAGRQALTVAHVDYELPHLFMFMFTAARGRLGLGLGLG